jgi:hypothetical protein
MTDNLRDQLHWRLGDRLLCGETVGLILPNYRMGRGPWHHMFRPDGYVSLCSEVPKDFCWHLADLRRLSTRRSARGFKAVTSGIGTRGQHFHPEGTCAGSIQGLAKLPRRQPHRPAEVHR